MAAVFGFLVAWANAPFAIAAALAAIFALLQVTGVMGLLAGGGDSETDGDVGHEVDHDVDHDADAEHDHADAGARQGWGAALLSPIGLGKIPFSVIWQTFALAFAMVGFGLNLRYLGGGLDPPIHTLAWTVPASTLGAYAAVAAVARLLGPVLSSQDQEATSRAELVGQIGVVISSRVDEEFGEVRIRDKTGHDLRVICKLVKGSTRPVLEQKSVVVVDYDTERGELLVEPLDQDDAGGSQNRREA